MIIIDLETSGFSQNHDKIIEIGACLIRGYKIVDTFHSLVNPQCQVSGDILNLVKLSSDALLKAPTYDKIANDFFKFCIST